jgi:hypothetical protein
MNLLNYLGPASSELQLAIKDAGFEDIQEYMKNREGGEMTVEERIAYHLGQVNRIAQITQHLENVLGDEEE